MSDVEGNLDALIEELEQAKYALHRELELATLRINSVEEEMQLDAELAQEEDQGYEEEIKSLEQDIMMKGNQMFNDSALHLDTSSFQDSPSTSYLDASSLDVSSVMEASIHEPEEISMLTNELKDSEFELKEVKYKQEDLAFQLQEIRNQNLIAENELKHIRHEIQTFKEEFKELEEDVVLINAEMSLLPRLKQEKTKENSIYDELVRFTNITKTELLQKKQNLATYVQLLHEIEAECKQIEGEILVLDVYDREDETRKLQSLANLLEANKNYHKELEKNIQSLQTSVSDLPSLIHSLPHNPDLVLKTVSQYHDFVNVRLKKLKHELTYHKMELASVTDKETGLLANVQVLKQEADKCRAEFETLRTKIQEIKSGIKNISEEKPPGKVLENKADTDNKALKQKSVRFQATSPVKIETSLEEGEDKENEREEDMKPMEKAPQPQQKIVIHKRRQNKKPVTIIKHY